MKRRRVEDRWARRSVRRSSGIGRRGGRVGHDQHAQGLALRWVRLGVRPRVIRPPLPSAHPYYQLLDVFRRSLLLVQERAGTGMSGLTDLG